MKVSKALKNIVNARHITGESRLPVEFKIHGITSMETANAFLAQFIKSFNKKFAVEPENPESAFRELNPSIELDHILCIKRTRTIIEGSAFSYCGQYYQLIKNGKKAAAMPKAKLTVLDSPKIGIKAICADVVYDTKVLDERPKKAVTNPPKERKNQNDKVRKPSKNHPWRQVPNKKSMLLYEETDTEIIEILNGLFGSTRAWV